MKWKSGQNLVEIVIVISLIVICAIFILTILGKTINESISRSSNKYSNFDPYGSKVTNNFNSNNNCSGLPGTTCELAGGSVITYNADNTFDILIDNITINGVPNDLTEVLEANGSAGATEVMAALIEQLASQLPAETEEVNEQVQVLLNLASTAREIASLEKDIRLLAQEAKDYCDSSGQGQYCDYKDSGKLDEMLGLVSDLTGLYKPSDGPYSPNSKMDKFSEYWKNEDFNKFKEVYPQSAALVETLNNEILSLAHQVQINSYVMTTGNENGGILLWNAKDIVQPGFDNPDAVTDLDGEIICQVGNGQYKTNGCK